MRKNGAFALQGKNKVWVTFIFIFILS